MDCSQCHSKNDEDAVFCSECGAPVRLTDVTISGKNRKVYWFLLLLIPVAALAVVLGYYKYMLPSGIAAVVNGEEIQLSELDSAVGRVIGSQPVTDNRVRYQVLNSLITERLIAQEARKAGMEVSREDVSAAVEQARAATGATERDFIVQTKQRYGSMREYEKALSRSILINRFLVQKVIPPGAGPRAAQSALEAWLQNVSSRATVRVTLAEQWSGAGCACCNKNSGRTGGPNTDIAARAGLEYWHKKHGPDKVTANVRDFGCHMQVDILRGNTIIASLRYQGGVISEP